MARILIADDEPQIRNTVASIMKEAGHETFEAFDGLSALDDVKDLKPDLLLLDWMIPELFGGEVLDRIRNDAEFEEVKDILVVIVSDFDDETSRQKFQHAGANDFVAKRDDPKLMREPLVACVNGLLKQKAQGNS